MWYYHLDREGARLGGGVTLLGRDGDLHRHQSVGVIDYHLRAPDVDC